MNPRVGHGQRHGAPSTRQTRSALRSRDPVGGIPRCRRRCRTPSKRFAPGAGDHVTAPAQWQAAKAAAGEPILSAGGSITHHHGLGAGQRALYSREVGALSADACVRSSARSTRPGSATPASCWRDDGREAPGGADQE
ncbi:MAG: FAD-linked oxidase C-terminal domain-containing protein [Solirubrobacteraceae bacterium]